MSGANYRGDGRDDERSNLPDKSKLYKQLHKTHSTKATMSKHLGTDVYPHKSASFNDHGNAQITRSNTRDDGDYRWHADLPRRNEVSRENHNNFNKVLPDNHIQPRDFAYGKSNAKHWKSPELGRDHSVTVSSVRHTIRKYPMEEPGPGSSR
ncbi:hypothetical protein A1O3_09037 [Capronia epimyces CBS 606.96]|uniref:Uncharacterized protein n=1 Tax=Capronia epimyces CBS 606.96 TaxID=1182542 RepID=W9XCF8_9EURO|nr:uncharacterized protein A1O3_09037 [Capronia epimyces CBS 606.96]EXJ77878.1 hypothetical protein A1O3_09037 [Capronia epimyces CBS 606.96]